ncbi:MAG: hypothetical protein M1818_001802 [Claussenomyces sp. TS43310]|nr:MAG: hypothetical protein M1818_001802 [Claussenomyces sp. TS43310]
MSSQHVEHPSHTTGYDARRLQTGQLELGVTDAVQAHIARQVVAPKAVSQVKLDFEARRPRWLREMMAEATGVFFYVYPGIASTAVFFLNNTEPQFSSLLQIGFAYAIGIAFAIITCGATSGGHFNPAVTICFALWQGFPLRKVPYYIFAQIFGAFMAGLILVGQYHPQMIALEEVFRAKGLSPNSLGGPGSILCSFPIPTETNYGYLFLIEFFADSFIGIVIWACLDPANPFVAPTTAPYTIGFAYGNMVWGFASFTIATNTARDLGTRIVAAIFFGGDAFNRYAAIAILTNIPATIFATGYYEFLMRDSVRRIGTGHVQHEDGEEGLMRHLTKTGTIEQGMGGNLARGEGYENGLGGEQLNGRKETV